MSDQLNVIDELERRLIEACYGERRGRGWFPAGGQLPVGGRAWLPAAVTAAVAVIAAVVVALALLPGGEVTPSIARAALDRAANASVSAPDTALGPGKVWYVRVITSDVLPTPPTSDSGLGATAKILGVRDVWMAINGSTRTRSRTLTTVRGRRRSSGRVSTRRTKGDGLLSSPLVPVPLFSYRQLRALPTKPARLLKVIAQIQEKLRRHAPAPRPPTTAIGSATGHKRTVTIASVTIATGVGTVVGLCCGSTALEHRAVRDLNTIAWLLALPVTPAVRAALYRTAASLPGVRYDGTARDSLGRRGVEISVGAGDDKMLLIFDEHSGALLASSSSFGALAQASGFGPLVQTIATEKVVSAGR
jgi:hypothetical protein